MDVDLTSKTPETDEEVMEYLSEMCPDEVQRGAAQGVYRVRRARGDSVERAYATTLLAILGQPVPDWVKEM